MPATPGRFSATPGCPQVSLSRCASWRATRSVEPPAGNGTTMRTVLLGKGSAARAATATTAAATQQAMASLRVGMSVEAEGSNNRAGRPRPRWVEALSQMRRGGARAIEAPCPGMLKCAGHCAPRAVSSAVERSPHTGEVAGSKPAPPTSRLATGSIAQRSPTSESRLTNSMGDVFVPLTRPQQESNDSALWFAFQGSRMLVEAASTDAGVVPRCLDLEQIGLKVRRTQYLGLLDGQHCYSAELDDESAAPPGMAFEGLRGLLGQFDDTLIGVASRAFQGMDWDRKHQFGGQCGAPTRARANERARDCPNCRISSYPKICPAMMVLVTRGREILLGRKFSFAKNRYSALAGFVEAGESLEQTIAREVREEVGVEIGAVHYFGSQSW